MRAFVAVALVGSLLVIAFLVGNRSAPDEPSLTASSYDPVREGEELPAGFRQLLPRDAILPLYEPEFVAAGSSGWPPNTLVIGVEVEGEARAYPISFLNRREMVIDQIAGIPILVTW